LLGVLKMFSLQLCDFKKLLCWLFREKTDTFFSKYRRSLCAKLDQHIKAVN